MSSKKIPQILALIPARAGSKRLKKKNVLMFNGLPLISWTINSALKSKFFSKIVVSTDDNQVIKICKKINSLYVIKRPSELASDHATSIDVALHALDMFDGFDYFVLLQPTSPLRDTYHIDKAIEFLLRRKVKSAFSVCESTEISKNICLLDKNGFYRRYVSNIPSKRRIYDINGGIYINDVKEFRKCKKFVGDNSLGYIMPQNISIDIDTLGDFKAAEKIHKILDNEKH